MDWRSLPSDSRLHDLIFYRVAEANPEMGMEELYESRGRFVKEFDIYIGSQSATIQYGLIDSEVMTLFAHGACALLAYALHRVTGLPIVLWSNPDKDASWSGHAALLVGPETVLDVRGVHSFDEVTSYYEGYGSGVSVPQTVSLDVFLKTVASSEEYQQDPLSFVDELEQLLIMDFAERLVEEHKIPVAA